MANILIIDDNPLAVKLVDFLLVSKHHETRTAANANEALVLLKTFQPEIILMDLQLPGVDGFELTRKLKDDPKYKHIIIIAITAYAMKGDRERAMDAGCDDYIAKPIDVRTLPDIIEKHLQAIKKS